MHVLHYANHAEANLRDARAALALAWQRATAAGSINERGVEIVLAAAEDVQRALHQIFREAPDLRPGEQVLADLNGESWAATLGELGLGVPVRENMNDWLRVVDGWVNHAAACLSALGGAALDELLRTKAMIAAAAAGEPLAVSPLSVPSPPPAYDTLALGNERALRANKPDLWERFQSATGFLPGLARSCVAVGIIGTVLAIGWSMGKVSVVVYNGLAQSVVATVNGQRVELTPGSHAEVEVHGGLDAQVVTRTLDGEPIESFSAAVRRKATHMVYTVASAAPLREWTAPYGSANADAARLLSPQRWQPASADVVFARPPERINVRGGGVRTVVDAADRIWLRARRAPRSAHAIARWLRPRQYSRRLRTWRPDACPRGRRRKPPSRPGLAAGQIPRGMPTPWDGRQANMRVTVKRLSALTWPCQKTRRCAR
ncbi:hypothetical protein [Cupriavidus basilensis]|uniref:hypothetical protein n=1 Tax=Cupriavidus basilensis TaxID=68895 RepID=UPI00157AEA2F|nr:hypothetical protein [Cupriavidus basilensis]NUA31224.1 hypothetical protein [Cupriavidus basilensis]